MPNPSALRFAHRARLSLIFVLAILTAAGCATHKTIEVPKPLTPLVEAGTPQLIAEINRLSSVRSIHGKVDIQFEDTSFATAGIAEKYRTADGAITLQRPGKIYLVIQVPLLASDVAQMTSDGERFRIAILKGEEQYRRFVRGTNDAVYAKLESAPTNNQKNKPNKEAQAVSALSNLRPQHLTDAMLIRPIGSPTDLGLMYAQTEFFQEERDPNPESKKRIVRGYYVLDELQPAGPGNARLLRRFWFDRVGGIRLARMQTFDPQGGLITDVTYGAMKGFGGQGSVQLPSRIELTRPRDQYKVSVTYQSAADTTLDHEYPPEAFVLENRWQLKEVDLDERKKSPQP